MQLLHHFKTKNKTLNESSRVQLYFCQETRMVHETPKYT